MTAHDRLTGTPSQPEPGWSGRWFAPGGHVLDPNEGGDSRDQMTSVDLESIAALRQILADAFESGSWAALDEVPVLAQHEDGTMQVQPRETVLEGHIDSLEYVCKDHFITRIGELSMLVPAARVRKPARKAIERLSGHTEDWAARTLGGPVARRALAVTRVEDADLYENRMVTELVHPILSTALSRRLSELRRRKTDLDDLLLARDEGTRSRREHLYRFWGDSAEHAADAAAAVDRTLARLQRLSTKVQKLRGSALSVLLRGRRTGQRNVRNTNVIVDNRHYRSAAKIWRAYEAFLPTGTSSEERQEASVARHIAFDRYVVALLVQALGYLDFIPEADNFTEGGDATAFRGPWTRATVTVQDDGVIVIESHGCRTRVVPLLDLVGPDDSDGTVGMRWVSAVSGMNDSTVVVYTAPSHRLRQLHDVRIAAKLTSSGPDGWIPSVGTAVPVSPYETTSLERVARALALAIMLPALEDYPIPLALGERRIPRRLLDELANANLADSGLSPMFHRMSADQLGIRRPLTRSETSRFTGFVRSLSERTRRPGWERDISADIALLESDMMAATSAVEDLLTCPSCHRKADATRVARRGVVLSITCASCGMRWGHETCGNCQSRIPIIEPDREIVNPEVSGPGWVERVFGQEALSSPCWARTVPGRYVCPTCRVCSESNTPAGEDCIRCNGSASEDSGRPGNSRTM
jgi:hypothetical protein